MMRKFFYKFFCIFFLLITILAGCTTIPISSKHGHTPINSAPPTHIALLLPIEGEWVGASQAIRNGFFSAYYAQHNQENSTNLKITVYDTTQKDISAIYQQAIHAGADRVVGPLTKEEVQTLAQQTNVAVPTLALNTLPPSFTSPDNFYQFSLSPQDEAIQVAQRAYHDGHLQIFIIAPSNTWGQSIVAKFSEEWHKLGGSVVDNLTYSAPAELTNNMETALGITQSIARAKEISRVIGQQAISVPQHRSDVDAIFLVANPQIARQVKPLLAFYYAGNIPVYATSSIYTGTPSPRTDHDLDGILFCDMPWVFNDPLSIQQARQQAQELWPSNFRQYPKLYAMGIDAYRLITQLYPLTTNSQFKISGMTGILSLDPEYQIHRQLQWARIQEGLPYPLHND